jgi:hypothetical protein
VSRASLPHSSHWNTGKLTEPYIAKLRRRGFTNESDEGSNFFPLLFSLSTSLQRYIRQPRDRGFDPARLIVFVRAAGSDKLLGSSGGSGVRLEIAIWSIPRLRGESAVYYKSLPWEASRSSFDSLPGNASVPSTHHTSLSYVPLAGRAASQPCSALCCQTLRLRLRWEKFRTWPKLS